MVGDEIETLDGRAHEADDVVTFLRVLWQPLARAIAAEIRKAPVAPPDQRPTAETGEMEGLRPELAAAHQLIRTLHDQLRKTQDDLAAAEVRWRGTAPPVDDTTLSLREDYTESDARHDRAKAKGFDAAQKFEDRSLLGRCESCAHCPGGICGRDRSPHANKRVGAGWRCQYYERTTAPIFALPPDDESPRPVAAAPGRHPAYRGKTEKGRCPGCGHLVCVRLNGGFWPHDVHGVHYRGGRHKADHKHPCPQQEAKP